MQNAVAALSSQLSLPARSVQNVIQLLGEGATVPFIARYRKEATGSLDEVQIGAIQEAYTRFQELEKRREVVLKSLAEQGKLTPDLRRQLSRAPICNRGIIGFASQTQCHSNPDCKSVVANGSRQP